MNAITFTPQELVTAILGVCGGITTVSVALTYISKVVSKVRAPELKQDERLAKLEERIDALEKDYDYHDARIEQLEKGNVYTQRAILELLTHGINGDNTEAMIQAKSDLQSYLTEKGVISHAQHD